MRLIGAMRTLALDYLIQQVGEGLFPTDPEEWYRELRRNEPAKMFPYLVEDSGKIEQVYVLSLIDPGLVAMSVQDIGVTTDRNNEGENASKGDNDSFGLARKLPFMKPSGSQSAQVGPVLKRTYDKNKGPGPTEKILNTTIAAFREIAEAGKPWSPFFQEILEILWSPKIKLPDGTVIDWWARGYSSLLACAVEQIGPQKNTVFLTVLNREGKFPGECPSYLEYLMSEKLAGERYVTGAAPAQEQGYCPLCQNRQVTILPNALKGAGINLLNADRIGVFPGINPEFAWKKYGLCGSCADLLYVYKFHVLKKNGPRKDRVPFAVRIAGDNALVIPSFLPGTAVESRQEILLELQSYIANADRDVEEDEETLLDLLKEEDSILNLQIIWADVGQEIGNVTGMITNILPSRLRELSAFNAQTAEWQHALFPRVKLRDKNTNFQPDLALRTLRSLFHRPGGKKVEQINKSKNLQELKRQVAAAVYHKNSIPEQRFWDELLVTARSYWLETIHKGEAYGLLHEGEGRKGPFLTVAGWVKYLNWWLYYFKRMGVLPMATIYYQPTMETLKPYFGPESGIDSPEKAFAFLVGVLYGKVLQVQGAKGVNVSANALTWLKRLTLKGQDLPSLYVKIREKMLAYGTESSEDVRMLLTEVGHLGIRLGDEISLSEVQTNYYLLLGQSMTGQILASKNKGSDN